jgi:hypothetical protein
MKIINAIGNLPYIGHFPGKARKYFAYLFDKTRIYDSLQIPQNITIVTFCTKQDNPILMHQIRNLNFINCAKNISKSNWNNKMKIPLLLQALKDVETEYCLVMDSFDTLFFRDLDDGFVSAFEAYGKKVLFNATGNNYPPFEIENIPNRNSLGTFKYFNAGVCFGKTKDIEDFYVIVEDKRNDQSLYENFDLQEYEYVKTSEQFIIRKVFANHTDTIGFDYKCNCFQPFNNARVERKGPLEWVLY